jgi:hypothetical protein
MCWRCWVRRRMPMLPVDREYVGAPRHQQLLRLPHLLHNKRDLLKQQKSPIEQQKRRPPTQGMCLV